MYSEINDQIIHVKQALHKKRKWELQLADYKEEREQIEALIASYKSQLTSEMKDVEKLEKMSFSNLFQTFFGAKEEKLTKEKQEVATVKLQLKKATGTKQEIDRSINEIEDNLVKTADAEKDYHYLISLKEKKILVDDSAFTKRLFELGEREADTEVYLTELKEAIAAGNHVIQTLAKAIESLEGAQGWGTMDLFGGGMISGLAKHSYIDEATDLIHQAQTKMRHFQKELLDIEENVDITIDISGLLKFADFFFDGFITDWMVQGRIEESLDQATKQQSTIKTIIRKLDLELEKKEDVLDEVRAERVAAIERI
ncbi:hypothetical protein [Oceanobacillus massiliensis]|uniref:hypothetical protein n=1 Tax=Oceanobacillus massiliensis TaxID=1465765 RepID=UPI000287F950|nr:hypothetical protein [Oceanobacillus massiliensis]